jgi:hypothetical protein
MKKPLLFTVVAGAALATVPALIIGTRLLGPNLIYVAAPGGTPIGEYDVPRPETSLLAVNIATPISLLNEIANAEVPSRFEGKEEKNFHKNVKKGSYAWDVTRGGIEFQSTGDQLVFSVPFAGTARVSGNFDAKILTVPIDGSVDLGGTAGGSLLPRVMPDWQINPNLTPSLNLDKAALSLGQFGKLDISDLLGSSLGQYLQREISTITPALTKTLNLRHEVARLWDQAYLSDMVSDDPPLWIQVTPQRLLVAPIDCSRPDQVSVTVAVEAATYLTNREPVAAIRAPLPDMVPLEGPTGTDLNLPVILSMNELNEVLKSGSFGINTGLGTKVAVSGLEAEVGQGGFLNLKLNLEADKSLLGRGVAGSIWVRGKPVINYVDQTLGFTGVELTVETRDKLTGAAAWLLEGFLVKGIESELRVDLNDYKSELDREVQKAIVGADLPEGIDLSLKNLEVKLTDIYTITRHSPEGPADPGIVLVIRATGEVDTRLDQLVIKLNKEP